MVIFSMKYLHQPLLREREVQLILYFVLNGTEVVHIIYFIVDTKPDLRNFSRIHFLLFVIIIVEGVNLQL